MNVLNVTASVLQSLREKIIICELKPGYKLNELNISTDLGISRPPLREAFRILEKDHMVVNIPRKGTYVAELSVKDFIEVSQVREMIECYCVDLLKASNTRDLPKVKSALDKAMGVALPLKNVDRLELLKYIKVFLDFHKSLIGSSENSVLISIYSSISFNLARYQFIYFYAEGTAQHSLEDHNRVLELIRNGDYDQAKEELKRHINYTVELVKTRILDRVIF